MGAALVSDLELLASSCVLIRSGRAAASLPSLPPQRDNLPAPSHRALWKCFAEPENASSSWPNPLSFMLAHLPLLVTPRPCLYSRDHEDARTWSSFPSAAWQDLAVRGGSCVKQQKEVEICLAAAAQRLLSAAHQTHCSRETLESAPAELGLRGKAGVDIAGRDHWDTTESC